MYSMAQTETDLRAIKLAAETVARSKAEIDAALREASEGSFQPPQADIEAAFGNVVELGRGFGTEYGFPEGSSVLVKRDVGRKHRNAVAPYRQIEIGVSNDASEVPAAVNAVDDPRANLVVVTLSSPSRLLSLSPANTHKELSFSFRYHRHPDEKDAKLGVSSSAQQIPWHAEFEFKGEGEGERAGFVVPNTTPEHFGLLQRVLGVLADETATRAVTPTRYVDTPVWTGHMQRETLQRGRNGRAPRAVRS